MSGSYHVGDTLTAAVQPVAGPVSMYQLSGTAPALAVNGSFHGVPIQNAQGVLDYYSTYINPTLAANFPVVPQQIVVNNTGDVIAGGPTKALQISLGKPMTLPGSYFTDKVSLGLTGGAGGVSVVNLTSGGSGYTSAPAVSFSGGGGTGAAATAFINAMGIVSGVVVTATGTGYTSAPTVAISGSATATATIDSPAVFGASSVSGSSGGSFTDTQSITYSNWDGSGHSVTFQVVFQLTDNTNGTATATLTASATFSGAGGATITGTNPVTVTGSYGSSGTFSASGGWTVIAGGVGGSAGADVIFRPVPFVINTAPSPIHVGVIKTIQLQSGGDTPTTWSVSTGSLPTGMTLNSASGAITGTPTTTGSYKFSVLATTVGGQTFTTPCSIMVIL